MGMQHQVLLVLLVNTEMKIPFLESLNSPGLHPSYVQLLEEKLRMKQNDVISHETENSGMHNYF
jgi:hypothetical protein